jgi:hypothetical protein
VLHDAVGIELARAHHRSLLARSPGSPPRREGLSVRWRLQWVKGITF